MRKPISLKSTYEQSHKYLEGEESHIFFFHIPQKQALASLDKEQSPRREERVLDFVVVFRAFEAVIVRGKLLFPFLHLSECPALIPEMFPIQRIHYFLPMQ